MRVAAASPEWRTGRGTGSRGAGHCLFVRLCVDLPFQNTIIRRSQGDDPRTVPCASGRLPILAGRLDKSVVERLSALRARVVDMTMQESAAALKHRRNTAARHSAWSI
jgi:hypothetical protein